VKLIRARRLIVEQLSSFEHYLFAAGAILALGVDPVHDPLLSPFALPVTTVGGFIKRKRETGSISPDKFGGYKTFLLEPPKLC
jgi:hypothetical protein